MGTWGAGVLQDDTIADVIGFIKDRLKAGETLAEASRAAASRFSETQEDDDEAPLLWLALAEAQWKYGTVDPEVLSRVRSDVASSNGLARWQDNAKALALRKSALAKFLAKINSPNPKPSRPPKMILRAAPFHAGDCLSVQLPDGRYTAALVLRTDNSNPEYGKNLVASLDYLDAEPPALSVFEHRPWLMLSHGNWNGAMDIRWCLPVRLREMRKSVALVGNVKSRHGAPHDIGAHAGWNLFGTQIVLERAHREASGAPDSVGRSCIASLMARLWRHGKE